MRLARMLEMVHASTSGRLVRLATRLGAREPDHLRPRDAVRLVWLLVISDVVQDRVKYHITDN